MASVRLLHPRSVQKSEGPGAAVVTTGDRGWCSGKREAAASAEATWCLISLVRWFARQASVAHDSTIGAIVSARDGGALALAHRHQRDSDRRRCWWSMKAAAAQA